jgi:transposase-like protein
MTLAMGIIKIEVKVPELVKAIEEFKNNRKKALEVISTEVREGVSEFFGSLLNTEMEIFLGQPDQAGNKRNGYETREYALKGVGAIRVKQPIDRKRQFKSSVLPTRGKSSTWPAFS